MLNVFGQTFANARTEDQIVAHDPINVILGKKLYELKPLGFNKNKAWRNKVAAMLNEISGTLAPRMDSTSAFMGGFMAAFFEFPEKVLDLIFAYSEELVAHKEAIMEDSTDEEIVVAFSRVMAVAYPFFGLLGTMRAVAATTNPTTSQR